MKIRNFLTAIAAVITLGFAVSCDDNNDPTLFDEIQVSSSYVSIDQNGGSNTINLYAKDSWTISGMPEWLTVSPTSGSSNASISFSAEGVLDGRTAELAITCGNRVQRINVIQGLAVISPATCAEVLAGPDSKNYQVTGICTAIANTQYGNWYLNDGTGEIYIYGTVNASGAYSWSSFNIEVGDEVTVSGPKTTYNGTVELVDATFIKVNKSLIKCDSTMVADVVASELPSDGGEIVAFLSNKGNGLYVDIPEDAQDWLSIASLAGNKVTFKAAPNTAGPRQTTLVFRTTDGKKNYTAETSISQAGLSGTLELPMTVEEAIAAANAGIATPVYVKGIVSQLVKTGYDANYGNGSFWISADGTYNDDLALDFEVYQANWLGGEKWTEDNAQIAVGAEVLVYGPLTTYKGTAETQGKGAAHVYSVNGVTSDANGIGSLENPFNVAGGIAAANAGIASNVYVQGIVSELVKGGFDPAYGNGSFWISEDGVKAGDLALDFEAYQVNYLRGEKWTEEDPQIAVGDVVVLYGPLTTYKGTAETQGKGAAYVYLLNPESPTAE